MKEIIKKLLPIRAVRQIQRALVQLRMVVHRLRWAAHVFGENDVGLGTFDGFEIAYRVSSVDIAVLWHSFSKDIFLREIPEYSLHPDAVVLDVGAHIGTFSLLVAAKAPHGRIFAVEAARDTFNLLRTNVALNHLNNIFADHLALSDRTGMATLSHDPDGNYGNSITKQFSVSSEEVPCTTLSRYLDDREIRHIDLAKFNCEGAEFPILLSTGADVLQRICKMIILYHCDLVQGASASALTEHLAASGFETRIVNQSAERGWIIATRYIAGSAD